MHPSIVNPDFTKHSITKSQKDLWWPQTHDLWTRLIVLLTHSKRRAGAFIFGLRVSLCFSIAVLPPLVGEDIKMLGFCQFFSSRDKIQTRPFFSLPVSHFPGCQAVVTWKQWQGRGEKHISLPMQIFLSAQVCKLWAELFLYFDISHSKLYFDTHSF